MRTIYKKTFSNEAMKPSRLQNHLNKLHLGKKDNNEAYFEDLKKEYIAQSQLYQNFFQW